MSTISCDLYRINFDKKLLLPVLIQLELIEGFEPIEPIIEYKEQNNLDLKEKILKKYKLIKNAQDNLSLYYQDKNNKLILTSSIIKSVNSNKKKLTKEVEKFNDLLNEIKGKELELNKLNLKINIFEEIKDSEVKIHENGSLFNTILLKLDVNSLERIKYDAEENDLITLFPIKQLDTTHYVLLAYNNVAQSIVDAMLENKNIEKIPVQSNEPVSVKNYYEKLVSDKKILEENIKTVKEKLKEISSKNFMEINSYADLLKIKLKSLEDSKYVGIAFDQKQALSLSDEHKETINKFKKYLDKTDNLHIDGWVLPEKASILENELGKISKSIKFNKLNPEELSEQRAIMKNRAIFQPFELVTGFMGTPDRNEIDPSPFVAPFFIVFFGFALGDAGYGIIMTLICIYALIKKELKPSQKNAVLLMLYCGISTIFFGALTGGWFGADLKAIGAVGEFLARFKVIDISQNIMLVLIGSLTIGFIHQIFGLSLRIYSDIKNGDIKSAIYGPLSWIILLFTIVFFALKDTIGLASAPWNIILSFSVLYFAWGQGYGTKNILLRPIKGLAGLFNITGFLSNTLSYARLLALGLATGVIASVVNLLAVLFSGDTPIVSQLIAGLILVLGHAFNIVLNVVGTFINVVRLHLVEFFPHFFEAKGTEFSPLKIELDNSELSDTLNGIDFVNLK